MRKFKYYQTFATKQIRLIYPEEKSIALAKASLESLKSLLPNDLNIPDNPDLLFNSFNAAVVNRVNLNDDGILPETALNIYKKFFYKFCDLEHERTNIVGFIINTGLSEFGTNRIVTEQEALASNLPFNISLGGVVWPVVDPQFADLLAESSDVTSEHYQEISASWEIGFDEMYLAIGSKDLTQAEIIKDPHKVDEMKQYLRIYNGTGKTNADEPIYRIIAGDALPLGIGYTTSPAAAVKGVIVTNPEDVVKVEDDLTKPNQNIEIVKLHVEDALKAAEAVINLNKKLENEATLKNSDESQKLEKNPSQEKTPTVKIDSNMKFTKLDDITDENLQQANAAAVKNFVGQYINEKIDEKSVEYAEQLEAKQNELKAKQEEAAKIQAQFEETKKQLETIAEELKKEQETRLAEKAQADFNLRMADLESKYELGDKELEVVAKKIRGLDDNAYAEWQADFEVLLAARKKKSEPKEEEKKTESKASVEEVLDNTKEEEKTTPPNTPSVDKTLRDEFAEAFKPEDFKINLRKVK